jgi:hypothetical protein
MEAGTKGSWPKALFPLVIGYVAASINLARREYYVSYFMHYAAWKPKVELELHGGFF